MFYWMKNNMKHYIIGEILENGEIIRGLSAQGEVYKNSKAFYEKSNEVCYLSELNDYKYTYKDFLNLAHGSEEVAEFLFDDVNYQSPEALLEDYLSADEVHDCLCCEKMYVSYGVDYCPYCGQIKNKK